MWEVAIQLGATYVHVYAYKKERCYRYVFIEGKHDIIVKRPSWWERLLGITYQRKIDKAIRRCQAWCDERNAKEKDAILVGGRREKKRNSRTYSKQNRKRCL